MDKFIMIVGIFAILLSFVTIGNSIYCFQCNSALDPECADLTVNDTSSSFYKQCEGNYTVDQSPFCRKYVTNVLHIKEEKDAIRIHRSCGWINSKNTSKSICDKDESDFIKKTSCACFSDGCNSSPRIDSSKYMLFLFIIYLCILF